MNWTPGFRLDIWTVGATILQLHLDSSTRLDAAVVLSITTQACKAAHAGQVLYLCRTDAPLKPMGRTGTHLFSFVPGEDDLLSVPGRLADALEAEPVPAASPVSRRRRKPALALGGALQAVGAALGGAV